MDMVRRLHGIFLGILGALVSIGMAAAEPALAPERARCPVCGMFVAKYPVWQAQVRHRDGSVAYFDGVKDMAVYLGEPGRYGDKTGGQPLEIWVKDYYTLAWVDGRLAWYVLGSDTLGPMGHELIPFGTRAAAESFRADHKGKRVLGFAEITPELVESLRAGQ
ncbi:MAG: nitrous oxide reductase accessory protein NosL [Thermodesulfobacteriota bacterium]